MKFKSRVIFVLLILISSCISNHTIAQISKPPKKDTISFPVDSTRFFSFDENGFPYGNFGNRLPIKNVLSGFQDFQPKQSNTGNAGSPEKQLEFYQSSTINFQRSQNSFSNFGFVPLKKNFYDSDRPYTKIQFIVAQKEELNVGVVHAHPLGKNCNVAFGFNRIRSTGFYQRQNTNNTSVNLNGWFRSPGRRYAVLSDLYWTGIDVAENGGIYNDSDFEFSHQLDRHIVPINLYKAETRQKYRGIWIKQYWSFGNVIDTLSISSDSLHVKTKISPSWAIVHAATVSDEKYVYSDQDPTSGFYQNIFRDTIQTSDSTYLWKLENGIWIERFDYHNSLSRKFSGKIGVKNELGEIYNDTIYTHFINYFVDGAFRFDLGKKVLGKIVGNGAYSIYGTNQSDYLFQTKLTSGEIKYLFQYFVSFQTSLQHPQFLFENYSGNHYRWKNDFYQTGTSSISAGLTRNGIAQSLLVSFGYFQFDSPIFFGVDQYPEQLNGVVGAFTGKLFWMTGTKCFKVKSDFTWNHLPSNSPIRLPEFVVRESVFGDFHVFKNALQLQVGIDATLFSAYYADAYNPNISQFYIQDSKEIETYVFLDPFVSIKVKPVRIFVKADHINANWMGRKYFQIPHYPQNDFALKFGLSWVFND